MSFKKTVYYILVALIIFTIIGCGNTRRETDTVNYRTGTQGLEMYFPSPFPDKIYMGQNSGDDEVTYFLEVRNKGAFPQEDELNDFSARLYLTGFDSYIVEIRSDVETETGFNQEYRDRLEGKSQYNPDGGFMGIPIIVDPQILPTGMPVYRPKVLHTLVYRYRTLANPLVCIDPTFSRTRVSNKVCEADDPISVSSQGAPIAVTNIRQDVTSSKMVFRITVTNVGDGYPIDIEDNSVFDRNPSEGYQYDEVDIVDFIVNVGSRGQRGQTRTATTGMQCKPDNGRIRLVDKKADIWCSYNFASAQNEAYLTPLNIQLDYGYVSSEDRIIEIHESII